MRNMQFEAMKLIIAIVDRGDAAALIELFNKENILQHYRAIGRGTATSEIMDLLGLDSLEKDIVLSIGKGTLVNQLLFNLNGELRGSIDTKGIVFDIPLSGIGQLAALMMLGQVKDEPGREDENMNTSEDYSMIMVTVNQGFTEEVMATARTAGARGGTILHARWAGTQSVEQFYGITVQAEKEVILIVAQKEKRNEVMQAINEAHGIKSDASGIVCCFGIENVVKL